MYCAAASALGVDVQDRVPDVDADRHGPDVPDGVPGDRAHDRRARAAVREALPHGARVAARAAGRRARAEHDPRAVRVPAGDDAAAGEWARPLHRVERDGRRLPLRVRVLDLVRVPHGVHRARRHHVRVLAAHQLAAGGQLAPPRPPGGRVARVVELEGAAGLRHGTHARHLAVPRVLPVGRGLHVLLFCRILSGPLVGPTVLLRVRHGIL